MRKDESVLSTIVLTSEKERLQRYADERGLSLSRYVAVLLRENTDGGSEVNVTVRHARDQHGSLSVTLPPEIVTALKIESHTPLAFTPVPGGALLRRVR